MIGHYLLTLTAEQEDRVLTGKMAPARHYVDEDDPECGCLMGVVHGYDRDEAGRNSALRGYRFKTRPDGYFMFTFVYGDVVGIQYDVLCERFGTERINGAIRNRILKNKAWRALADVQQEVAI